MISSYKFTFSSIIVSWIWCNLPPNLLICWVLSSHGCRSCGSSSCLPINDWLRSFPWRWLRLLCRCVCLFFPLDGGRYRGRCLLLFLKVLEGRRLWRSRRFWHRYLWRWCLWPKGYWYRCFWIWSWYLFFKWCSWLLSSRLRIFCQQWCLLSEAWDIQTHLRWNLMPN